MTRRLREPRVVLGAALALALVVPAAYEAGYTHAGRSLVIAIAGLALVAAIVVDELDVVAALRSGPVLALAALAVLSMVSAGWTLVRPLDSLQWGLVVASYAGVAVAAAVLVRRRGLIAIAALVALLGFAEAILGLGAAALRELPYAERIGGSWRAGGSFEYSAALALLEVAALPPLLAAMVSARKEIAAAAAAAGTLAVGVLVTAESRTELALAIVVVAVALTWPRATVRGSRTLAVAALALIAAGAVLVRLIVGGYVAPHEVAGGARRVLELLAVTIAAAAVWPWLRSRAGRLGVPTGRRARAIAALVAVTLAAVGFAAATASPHGRGIEPSAGFSHGRSAQWRAAWRSFLDRPGGGAGSDAFLVASASHQGRAPVRYAHDLPLEAGTELGAPGLVLVIALYVATATTLWRCRRTPNAWLVAPGVAAFMLANLVDWPWHLPLSGAVWALGLGAVVALAARPERAGQVPS